MGFVSSCFESARRDIDDAKAELHCLEREYNNTKWYKIITLCSLIGRIDKAKTKLADAEWQYHRLWT